MGNFIKYIELFIHTNIGKVILLNIKSCFIHTNIGKEIFKFKMIYYIIYCIKFTGTYKYILLSVNVKEEGNKRTDFIHIKRDKNRRKRNIDKWIH